MKHLKTYEAENLKLKKYIVLMFPTNMVICEVLDAFVTELHIKRLFTYNKESKELKENIKEFRPMFDDIKNDIIFEADDLDECINKLDSFLDIIKFNI